ncbi:MAG: 5-formyltetrahydrofolate cyclo-ligase [Bacteroidales bacterium]|jgi:5-formyltetrahydrofolate cyclo-ligase|nr:5-formyltetrahydrofolate cyclo-ligase [Bacteroidales bacterium]
MINQQKKEIRKQIKKLNDVVSIEDKKSKSKNIFKQIEDLNEFVKSEIIMLYWSMNDEVYTHDFIQKWANTKQIILPSVKGDKLELKFFTGIDDLVKGDSYGIGEPSGEIITNSDKIDLIIVPCVAFDKQNNRLGRGKAYYDKLLTTTKAYKIGVCFDFQLLDSVPVDVHDVKMDIVIADYL